MKRLIIITTLSFLISAAFASNEGKIKKSEKKSDKAKIEKLNELTPKTDAPDLTKYVVVDSEITDGDNEIPQDTQNAFSDELSYSKALRDNNENGMVFVRFTYDEDGYIKVLSSNASSEKLNEYIEDKLENIRLKNGIIVIGKEYYAKFHFKLL